MFLLPFRFGVDASSIEALIRENNLVLAALRAELQSAKEQLMTSQSSVAQQIQEATDQIDKARAEILAKLAELEGAIGEASPEVLAKLAALRASVQGVDDIVPDAPSAEDPPV